MKDSQIESLMNEDKLHFIIEKLLFLYAKKNIDFRFKFLLSKNLLFNFFVVCWQMQEIIFC